MHCALVPLTSHSQQRQVQAIICIFKETGLAVIAALRDMLWSTRQIQSLGSRHFQNQGEKPEC
jgi:hypothetical protein